MTGQAAPTLRPIDWLKGGGSARRLSMGELYWLTDEEMTRLAPYFPKSHGKPPGR